MKQKIAFVVSAPITARVFLAHHIRILSQHYDVTVVANCDHAQNELDNLPAQVHVHSLQLEREINFIADVKSLVLLTRFFKKEKFILVHSVSPKAGLITTMAGYFSGVSHRIHTFTGQVWVTQTGLKRWLLKTMDKWIARMATQLLADSLSQCNFLIEQCVVDKDSIMVLGQGSISGVNLNRFCPSRNRRDSIRSKLKIDQSSILLLYLGRLKVDKGVLDLANAFADIYCRYPHTVLLYVGPDEENLESEIVKTSGSAYTAIKFVAFTKYPEAYMAAADIFILPSYREGFGSAVIEAAACELPAIVSRIYGLTDAVEEGKTGILFEAGDVDGITKAVGKLIDNRELRQRLGKNARKRVHDQYSESKVTEDLCQLYGKLLSDGVKKHI